MARTFIPLCRWQRMQNTLQAIADEHRDGAITEGKAEAGNDILIDATSSAKEATLAWEKIAPYVEPKLSSTSLDVTATELTHEQWLGELDD